MSNRMYAHILSPYKGIFCRTLSDSGKKNDVGFCDRKSVVKGVAGVQGDEPMRCSIPCRISVPGCSTVYTRLCCLACSGVANSGRAHVPNPALCTVLENVCNTDKVTWFVLKSQRRSNQARARMFLYGGFDEKFKE